MSKITISLRDQDDRRISLEKYNESPQKWIKFALEEGQVIVVDKDKVVFVLGQGNVKLEYLDENDENF